MRQVELYLDACAKQRRFSGVVLIAENGKPLLRRAYGYADWEKRTPNTPTTKFSIFSMTKQFTAASILLLQERGKLRVSDRIANYFPDWPERWKAVTIEDIVTHTSGVPLGSLSFWLASTGRCQALTGDLPKLRKEGISPLQSVPSAKFEYSNAGYMLLSALITHTSGQSYREFIRANIFRPLGMTHSDFGDYRDKIPGLARGHGSKKGEISREEQPTDIIPGAGDVYSTVDDLLLWDQALYGDRLLSEKSRRLAFTPPHEKYAYAWFVRDKGGPRYYEHGGGGAGFNSDIVRFPTQRRTLIVLSNLSSLDVSFFAAMKQAAQGNPLTVSQDPEATPNVSQPIIKDGNGKGLH